MGKVRLIGDIHGNYEQYLRIIEGCDASVQVGDFGIGFRQNPVTEYDTVTHQFIRGNHDDPGACEREPNWIPDGTVIDDVMFVGGASSIDRDYRTPYLNWWPEEELSIRQMDEVADIYLTTKPRVMITHEVPDQIVDHFGIIIYPDESRTRRFFDELLRFHRPQEWYFGHWHLDFDSVIKGTRFKCLNINEYIDVDLNIW